MAPGNHSHSGNRLRGIGRGRGQSRGASTSSSKSKSTSQSCTPTAPQALQDVSTDVRSNHSTYLGKNYDPNFIHNQKTEKYSNKYQGSDTTPPENAPNSVEQSRRENDVKREQRGAHGSGLKEVAGGRAHFNKSVRFSNTPLAPANFQSGRTSKSPSPPPSNTFAPLPVAVSNATAVNPFMAAPNSNPARVFGAPSQPSANPNVFGKPSGGTFTQQSSIFSDTSTSKASSSHNLFPAPPASNTTSPSSTSLFALPRGNKSASVFGASSDNGPMPNVMCNPFGTPPVGHQPLFGAPSDSQPSIPGTDAFGASSGSQSQPTSFMSAFSFLQTAPSGSGANSFPLQVSEKPTAFIRPAKSNATQPTSRFASFESTSQVLASARAKNATPTAASPSQSNLAKKIYEHLNRENISPPKWPSIGFGDPNQKNAVENFWHTYKKYQSKVRTSLMRAGLLDDPDKPKKLSEAIDFKGTCELMCPEEEQLRRIVEANVLGPEKDESQRPAIAKMVKANARSSAGQDAPLPMDVRSPAALRKTLDYLFESVLQDDQNLPKVHGFLWDRTRAIRRDFVFQQSSMDARDYVDQVYCLELITRFHVVALHAMSNKTIAKEGFDEQQEVEQLGKTLVSLMHAYEDCKAQGISCENEAEFRAYFVLNNCHSPAILETVQDWGWKFWGESEEIKIAVNLVETLQNIWESRGPLKPYSATDIAQNGFSRFFLIIGDKKVSYIMACFAEMHFNSVRKATLKTILTAYRKQRDQVKDWTLTKLNEYLMFDEEEDVISFGESYGLLFEDGNDGTYLALGSGEISDPHPQLRQDHSYDLVERKRGDSSLQTAIYSTVYDEAEELEEESDDELLFVKETGNPFGTVSTFPLPATADQENNEAASAPTFDIDLVQQSPFPNNSSLNASQGTTPEASATSFSTPNLASALLLGQQSLGQTGESISSNSPGQKSPSSFTPNSQAPAFSFSNPPSAHSMVTVQPFPAVKPAAGTNPTPGESSVPYQFCPISTASSAPLGQALNAPSQIDRPPVSTMPSSQMPQLASSLGGNPPILPSQPFVEDTSKSPAHEPTHQQSQPAPMAQALSVGPTRMYDLDPQYIEPPRTPPSSQPSVGFQPFAPALATPSSDPNGPQNIFSEWYVNGEGGIMEQFAENEMERILRETFDAYVLQQTDRAMQEEENRVKADTEQRRARYLSIKYLGLWRTKRHMKWIRRTAEADRKAQKEMDASCRASRALKAANLVKDFKAATKQASKLKQATNRVEDFGDSTRSRRRDSLESLLDATGVLDGVHDSNGEIRTIVREDARPQKKRSRAETSNTGSNSHLKAHKRIKSDNPLRRSLFSDPSYLQGGSRRLLTTYDTKDDDQRQVSGVKTDYFRLKARGISNIPSKRPLAQSIRDGRAVRQKRSFEDMSRFTTPRSSLDPPLLSRSVPPKPVARPMFGRSPGRSSAERDREIQILKTRAREHVAQEPEIQQGERELTEDEDLFARAKNFRAIMDEGGAWYKKERLKIEASRSVS